MSAGTYFGKFFLLKRLAQGGMGEIYIARQQGPGGFSKTVALKKILPHLTENQEFIQGFLGEAALSAKMTHRNIVQVFDFGLDEETNSYFLTMEYIAGKPLNEIIEALQKRNERIPVGLVKDIAMQMCDGMSYAHNLTDEMGQPLNLVHRDLNPSNLLISYHGDVKIIDWGIAKSEMSQIKTEAGMIKGKFVYMSPEQSMAKPLDKRSDVFAAGITLYEMLTGENPFQKPNIVLSLEAIQRQDPPPPSHYDPAFAVFDPIVARALAKDKERRYPDCAQMAEELKALVVPPAAERVGGLVSRLFRDDLDQETKLLQETGAAKVTPPPRSSPGLRAPTPAPYIDDGDDEKGGTLVLGGSDIDQERLRREMEEARRKLDAAQAAHRASLSQQRQISGEAPTELVAPVPRASNPRAPAVSRAPASEPRTMFIGADELQPPPQKASNKGLIIGIMAGVVIGLLGFAAYFLIPQNSATADPKPSVVHADPPAASPAAPPAVEPDPEPVKEPVEEEAATAPKQTDALAAERTRAVPAVQPQPTAEEQAEAARQAEAAAKQREERLAAQRAEQEAAEKAKQAQLAAATSRGTLLVKSIPELPGRLEGQAIDSAGRVTLRNSSGTVALGDGDSPLRVSISYRVEGSQVTATINSDPWSILWVGDASRGKVPQTVEIGRAIQKLEFRRPGLDPSPRVMVMFTPD